MKITIMDYRGIKKEVDVGELSDIAVMVVHVITGDEILEIVYKDYTTSMFDSCDDRRADFQDGSYEVYSIITGNNVLENPKWLNRKDAYDYLYSYDEDEEMEEVP